MTATYFKQWTAEERSPYPLDTDLCHDKEDTDLCHEKEQHENDSDTYGRGCFCDLDISDRDFW